MYAAALHVVAAMAYAVEALDDQSAASSLSKGYVECTTRICRDVRR